MSPKQTFTIFWLATLLERIAAVSYFISVGSITYRIVGLRDGTGLGTGSGVGKSFICESEYLTSGV